MARAEMDMDKMRLGGDFSPDVSIVRHEKYPAYIPAEIVPLITR